MSIAGNITYGGAQAGPILVTAGQRRTGNQVLRLDGNGDFAVTPAMDVSGAELTVQYWFRGSVSQSAVRQQSGGWIVSTWNGLHILSNDGGVSGISAGANLTDGQWHHVAFTWTQGTPGGFASYLDGQLVAQRDSTVTPIPNHNAPFYFGAFGGTGEFATGELDEISIWRRALSGPEIAAGQRASLTGNEDGLAGYWNFDDGTGTDLSPNGNQAELNGDAVIVPVDIAAMGSAYTEAIANPGPYEIAHIPRATISTSPPSAMSTATACSTPPNQSASTPETLQPHRQPHRRRCAALRPARAPCPAHRPRRRPWQHRHLPGRCRRHASPDLPVAQGRRGRERWRGHQRRPDRHPDADRCELRPGRQLSRRRHQPRRLRHQRRCHARPGCQHHRPPHRSLALRRNLRPHRPELSHRRRRGPGW
ncbi:MAG: hypothetical protein M5U12_30295 [Verrucomicrobia bacterium]|nr:hypothetical protein [Verrucomicrobiota bacterium]